MTFRKITFIFIALLLSMLFLLQFWLIQNFTKDVSSKIGQAAFEVSHSTIETLLFKQPRQQVRKFAVSSQISIIEQTELLNSLSSVANDINISLKDGQKDNYLTINSAGVNFKVDIPRTGIEKSLDAMSRKILISAFAFILIGLLAANYFSRRLSHPLKQLQAASGRVGRGEFGFQVDNAKKLQSIEIQNTITAFNEMSQKINQLQKENETLQKQAQLSELSEITRGLAHTIRNPLNTLNLAVDELSSTSDDVQKKELSRISKFQIQRIDKWVRSLMDIMSSDTSLIQSIDVYSLLQSCIADISLSNTAGVKTELLVEQSKADAKNVYQLKAIRPELKSLLQSMISNSVEATEAIKSRESVVIELTKKKNTIEIIISDRGIGFSKEIKSKLFSPHNTNKTYGAGMGLYLAHRIITLKYDGDITIDDNPDQANQKHAGSRIVISLNSRV